MQPAAFEADLHRDGFDEIDTRALPAAPPNAEHSHPFAVRALVLEGDITLTVAGAARTYRSGEVFTMAPGCRHAEAVGPAGVRYMVGRRAA